MRQPWLFDESLSSHELGKHRAESGLDEANNPWYLWRKSGAARRGVSFNSSATIRAGRELGCDPRAGFMAPADALRYLDHEARLCREHDAHEALCLLLPALMRLMNLSAMDDYEALAFRVELHDALNGTQSPSRTN